MLSGRPATWSSTGIETSPKVMTPLRAAIVGPPYKREKRPAGLVTRLREGEGSGCRTELASC